MKRKNPQLKLLKNEPKAYGGELLKTRKGRTHGRPLDTRTTIHLVLRSSKAIGEWSFSRPKHQAKIKEIIRRFAQTYGVRVLSVAIVGNHLHLQIKLSNRYTYFPFIRAITAAIAMAITKVNRWNKARGPLRFWDYRPFTRVIQSLRAYLNLRDYIRINQMEGAGVNRSVARLLIKDRFLSSA
jgi:REP element-mobilizing transposase RayT